MRYRDPLSRASWMSAVPSRQVLPARAVAVLRVTVVSTLDLVELTQWPGGGGSSTCTASGQALIAPAAAGSRGPPLLGGEG
jgi:hypothetical protein